MKMHFIDRRVLLVAGICTLMKGSLSKLASPVIVSETDTARFRWQIPAGESFVVLYVKSPSYDIVLTANAANNFSVLGDYTTRVTYKGALSVRTMAFDLRDVQTTDSGTYKCGLNSPTNIIADCGQKLIVLGQPTKPVLKVPSTPVVGSQMTLTCMSSSTTVPSDHGLTLTYTWQRDNTDITVTSPGSPYIFTVNSRDSHSYRCRARESQGLESQWSDVYEMMPEYAPYDITLQPPSLFYNKTEGQESVPAITCTARCRPDCSYKWYKNATFYRNGATLNLGQTDRTQSGFYQCRANNTHGSTPGANVSVDITYKASIESFTANSVRGSLTVNESTPVTLTCQVDSNPRSTIKLMYGRQELKREGSSLAASTIVRPSCRQRGNYSCTANNNIGTEANSVVKLAVTCYPRVDETSNVQDKYGSSVGGNVTVSVPVLAYPVPTFTWRRNTSTSQNLSGSFILVSDIITNSELQLTRIQQQDLGEYTLTAKNGIGDPAVFIVTIVPRGPPEIPTNLTVRPTGPHSLVVAWKQEFNGGAEQTFTVEYSKDKVTWTVAGTYVESKETIYQQQTISELQSSTSYFVKVISRNEFGEKNYTESVSGQTGQDIRVTPPGPPAAVIGGVVGGVAILIVLAVVVAVVILRRKKEQNHHDGSLCDTSEEMKENDLYVGGEDLARGSSAAAVNMGDVYAMPDKKNKGKEKEGKATNMGDVYAMPDKKNKGKKEESKDKRDKKKVKKGLAEDKKQANPRRNRGDVYENATPVQYGAHANRGFEGEDHAASTNEDQRFGRNEDGLMYVGIDFGNEKPSQEIRKTEECTEYAGIAIGQVGAPLPDADAETTK